jgi:hypothetical protein
MAMTIEIWVGILVGICVGLTVIAILCAFLGIFAYSKVVGMVNSTHRIEYMDPNTSNEEIAEDFNPYDKKEDDSEMADFEQALKFDIKKAKYERDAKLALTGEQVLE